MLAMIISFIATIIVLVKLVFTDMSGGKSVKEGIQEGVQDAIDINEAISEALDTRSHKQEYKKEEKDPGYENIGSFKLKT